jgi:hypothetical protein
MRKNLIHIYFIVFFFFGHYIKAQQGFYVPLNAKIFFSGDTATIFSNVINDGNFGIGRKAFLNFSGTVWENDAQSSITDESLFFPALRPVGGWVRFMSPYKMQIIKGGYNAVTKNGPAFFNVDFQNPRGVELWETSLKIRRTIKMTQGLVYLRSYILSVGNNNPGVISGYDSSRFFVTNNVPGSGYLLRENISSTDGRIDFPIGSHGNAYTPLGVRSNFIQGDDYYATVFDSVKQNVFSGTNMNTKSVNKTWEVGKRFHPDNDEDEIFLQHLTADEGTFFNQNRQNTYVAQYTNTGWDIGSPQLLPDSGYITTGNSLMNSGVNNRIFYNSISNSSFFTKLTGTGDANPQTKLWFTGWRVNKDLVHLNWRTQPEINIQYFIVQRMLTNETVFTDRDTVLSQVLNGISYQLHVYDDDDPNSYTGISFYRLKMVNRGGTSFSYSPVIAIGNKPGPYINLLWPNPSPGRFYISLNPIAPVENIIVTNVLGQKILEEKVNGRTIIQMGNGKLISGSYFVSLLTKEGGILETKKLIVIEK